MSTFRPSMAAFVRQAGDDVAVPELQWPNDPDAYAKAAGDYYPGGPTVDDMLRDPDRIARKLRQIQDEWRIGEALFPRPIMDRVRDHAADLRNGRSLRRYRGDHRDGHHTVDELAAEIAADDRSRRIAHRRSLRRPFDPSPVHIGTYPTRIRFYGVTDPEQDVEGATIVLAADGEEPPEWTLRVPMLKGERGLPIEDIAEADTGPLVWQPAVALLADMFEPWPSVSALEGADRLQ